MQQSHSAPAVTVRPRVEELESRLAPSVSVRLDYTYDTHGFFTDPDRRALMQAAVDSIAPRLQDSLAAITPSRGNTWQANFFNPVTNSTVTLNNPSIGQNEIIIYVAGASIGSSELGLTTTGGFTASGSRAWLDLVRTRGQAGVQGNAPTDYSTWGGMVTFDSDTRWHFGTGTPGSTQYDFTSVALHELMHIFGFGLGEPAFTRHVSGSRFVGPSVVATAGAGVPVVGSPPDHWAPGTRFNGEESALVPSLPPGTRRTLTAIDYAALDDIGWDLSTSPPPITVPPPAPLPVTVPPPPPAVTLPPLPPSAEVRFAVGAGAVVTGYGATGQTVYTATPFGGAATSVRVTTADVTGDGFPDLIAGTGPGRMALVAVYDGRSGTGLGEFAPFEPGYTGGVAITTGDFTNDGRPDIVVTPDQTGGAIVAIYDGAAASQGRGIEITRFFGLEDPSFRGGARAAVGDVNRDGVNDLVVAAGFGGGPRVAVFGGHGVRSGQPSRLIGDFFAFEPTLRNGVYVAVADTDGDGYGEIVAGAGPGGAPRVMAFGARSLLAGNLDPVANFFAGDPDNRGGVRVATLDVNEDGRPDLVTGSGQGGLVKVYAARYLANNSSPEAWQTLTLSGDLADGVFVG